MWGQVSSDYKLLTETKSVAGKHKLYQEQHEGVEVFNSFARSHTYGHEKLNTFVVVQASADVDLYLKLIKGNHEFKKNKKGYWLINGNYLPAEKKQMWVKFDYPYQAVFVNDKLIHFSAQFHSAKDSVIQCNVFSPNPIVSANTSYGAPYFDNNDLSSMELNQELHRKKVMASFEGGLFRVRSSKVNIVDISQPPNPIPVNVQNHFYFKRSQPQFEVMNAYYHLSTFIDYVSNDLGFTSLFTKQLQVDVHALNNEDNSIYVGVTALPQILFGNGGVDDAEDGQVIIHELGHALTDATSLYSNVGMERKALDEGVGDYLSASYTRFLLPNNDWKKIPSWDGHNEFWNGRIVNSDKKYPDDVYDNIYQDGEIWSSALTGIETELGRDVTHKILIESSYLYHEQMSMLQAAEYFLKADSLLNDGDNSVAIHEKFCLKGLIKDCDSSSFFEGIVTVDFQELTQGFLLFSKNILQFKHLEIYDTKGKLVHVEAEGVPNSVDLRGFSPGVYFIRFGTEARFQMLKIMLF